ncbi:hypothetical protein [Nocardia australiensis]|uniref:hypothetical protein n=1 Tax=Nocardia australiensis TaxID=2887191 RepID=UPI001D1402A5|nr:hypothetical protein [Nocardia australiensis]
MTESDAARCTGAIPNTASSGSSDTNAIEASSDVARLLRVFAVRAIVLAILAAVVGATALAGLLVLAGLGLFVASVDRWRQG